MKYTAASIGDRIITLKVASTPQEQSQGYIGAKSIPMNEGILFSDIPPATSFHMRGVFCRLAIAFLDQDNRLISARTMEPEELWIPTPPGTRNAIEVHPDHLDAIRNGSLSIGGTPHTAKLSNRKPIVGQLDREGLPTEKCFHCGGDVLIGDSGNRDTETIGGSEVSYYECANCGAEYSIVGGSDSGLCQESEPKRDFKRKAQAGPWSAEKLDPDLVMEYEGYKILKSGDNFRVKDPKGYYMTSVASSVTMARKWIDWDIHENRNRRKGQAGPWNKDAKKPWSEQRAKEIEELLIDRNLTLSRALEYGLITEDEYGKWILWDYQTRLE